ncbi:MAG: DUF1217 domain-containing protein [Methylocapsa sp.]|nr:DUF1217 domain-containing protein [Methylocapsa sp.]
MSTISTYLAITSNMSRWLSAMAQSPEVSSQTKYFEQNIGKVTSASQLVSNPRLFNYAMTAFGLGDRTNEKGLMKEVLAQGVNSSTALANTLGNPSIRAFALAFDFASNGPATTNSPSLAANVVNRYLENSLQTSQGQQNPGVQLALYFQENAPSLTSIYGILGDKNLLTVVQTALGISPLTSMEPIDVQANALSKRINLADFQNPTKLRAFIERFSAMNDVNNGGSTGTSGSNIVSLLNTEAGAGVDGGLLLQAQNVNFGGL